MMSPSFLRRNSSGLLCLILSFFALPVMLTASVAAQEQSAGTQEKTWNAEKTDVALPAPGSQPQLDSARSAPTLRLATGDLIEVSVYNVPDLTTKVRITDNGDIYLPLIDYVHVGGLTVEETQNLIQKRLSDGGFVKDPHVAVFVDQYAAEGASVLGEVSKPGVYPVLGQRRLFDLISAAGGLTERAGRNITVTHRSEPDKPLTVPLSRNVADNPDSNVPVFPGDTIIVRKADVVYVVGDVGRPSGFLMDSGHLTVLQAIALAGGTTRTAKIGAARIIRKGPEGITETPVQLKKILEAKAPDLPMQADDILFIPTSATKALAGRTLEAAMQAATAVSIVAIQ
jgi:polysaccharide biosynthesis/export protein